MTGISAVVELLPGFHVRRGCAMVAWRSAYAFVAGDQDVFERLTVMHAAAWAYIVAGIVTLGLVFHPEAQAKGAPLYIILFLLSAWWVLAGVGVLRHRWWGYVLAMPMAIVILLAAPVGTILGGVMGYCLVKETKRFWTRTIPVEDAA